MFHLPLSPSSTPYFSLPPPFPLTFIPPHSFSSPLLSPHLHCGAEWMFFPRLSLISPSCPTPLPPSSSSITHPRARQSVPSTCAQACASMVPRAGFTTLSFRSPFPLPLPLPLTTATRVVAAVAAVWVPVVVGDQQTMAVAAAVARSSRSSNRRRSMRRSRRRSRRRGRERGGCNETIQE